MAMFRPMNSTLTSGNQILDQAGWLDHDNNPSTPRQAVASDERSRRYTPRSQLPYNLCNAAASGRRDLTQSLAECGIGLNIDLFQCSRFLCTGSHRSALWTPVRSGRVCHRCQQPGTAVQLVHQLANPERTRIIGSARMSAAIKILIFDAACQKALQTLSTDPEYAFHQEAQAIFAADMPVHSSLPAAQSCRHTPGLLRIYARPLFLLCTGRYRNIRLRRGLRALIQRTRTGSFARMIWTCSMLHARC